MFQACNVLWSCSLRACDASRCTVVEKRISSASAFDRGRLGNYSGDAKLEADGKADKVEGKVQNAVGGFKDALKN